ncbi:MAG: hypothetical protein ACE5JB_16255 [bacterium]
MKRFCLVLLIIFTHWGCSKENPVSPQQDRLETDNMIRLAVDVSAISLIGEVIFFLLDKDSHFHGISFDEAQNFNKNSVDWYIDAIFKDETENINNRSYRVTEYKEFNLSLGEYWNLFVAEKYIRSGPASGMLVKKGKNTVYAIRSGQSIDISIKQP